VALVVENGVYSSEVDVVNNVVVVKNGAIQGKKDSSLNHQHGPCLALVVCQIGLSIEHCAVLDILAHDRVFL